MERFLVEYLANSVWQAPMIASAAWLILRVARPAPLAQHRLWVGALALMVLLPAFSGRGGARMGVAPAPATKPTPIAAPVNEGPPAAAPLTFADTRSDLADAPAALVDASPAATVPAVAPPSMSLTRTRWLPMREVRLSIAATHWLVWLYLAAIAFMAIRLLCSWWGARRVVARARPAVLSDAESEMLDRCCVRFGVRRPKVLISAGTSSPMVVGVFDPVLLLPESLAGRMDELGENPEREMEAVWLHELAHVLRRDYLANLVCRVAALPVAYHPATHAVQQRIRRTREMVCDAMAAAEMQSAPGYARCLVGLAREMQAGGMTAQIAGAGMFDGGVLEERVMQLIETKSAVSVRRRIARACACAAILAAVTAAAATFHVSPMIARVVGVDTSGPQAMEIQAASNPIAPVTPAPTQTETVSIAVDAMPAPATAMAASAEPMAAAQAMSQATPATAAKPADVGIPPAAPAALIAAPAATPSDASAATSEFLARQLAEADTQLDIQAPNTDALKQKAEELARQIADLQARSGQLTSSSPQLKNKQLEALEREMAATLANYAAQLRKNSELKQTMGKLQSQLEQAEAQSRSAEALKNQARIQSQFFSSPEFRKQANIYVPEFDKQRADVAKAMAEARAKFDSAELAKAMADAQAKFNSPEFNKAMENLNSPEFKKQMEDAQVKLNNPEFLKQMQGLSAQMQAAQKANSPEFKQQMELLNQAMAEMQAKVNSPEFKHKMQKLDPEVKAQMEQMQKQLEETVKAWSGAGATAGPALK